MNSVGGRKKKLETGKERKGQGRQSQFVVIPMDGRYKSCDTFLNSYFTEDNDIGVALYSVIGVLFYVKSLVFHL